MSECKRERCEEEAACSYNNDYCSSTCEIMQLRRELKAKEEECERLKEWLKDEIAHASASSSRCDFNNATRRYWSAKTEAFECVLLRMEADK